MISYNRNNLIKNFIMKSCSNCYPHHHPVVEFLVKVQKRDTRLGHELHFRFGISEPRQYNDLFTIPGQAMLACCETVNFALLMY